MQIINYGINTQGRAFQDCVFDNIICMIMVMTIKKNQDPTHQSRLPNATWAKDH